MARAKARGADAEQLGFGLGDKQSVPDIGREGDRLERRRKQWREASRRRRARWREAPLGWAFPNDPPRGLGDNRGGRPAVIRDES